MTDQFDPTQYEPLIHKILKRFKNIERHREDLICECYLKMLEIAEQFDPAKGTMQTYLYLPLYNRCIDYLKQYDRNSFKSLDEPILDEEDESTTLAQTTPETVNRESQIDSKMEAERLLKTLKPNERLIFDLHFARDMSKKDIASLFHPITGIKSTRQLTRIIKKFQNDPNSLRPTKSTQRITELDSVDQAGSIER